MLFNDYRSSFLEIGQSGHENDHAPPFSAEVKNEWSQTSPPLHALMECAGTSVLVKNESASFFMAKGHTVYYALVSGSHVQK